jgi:chromosome segregation protein
VGHQAFSIFEQGKLDQVISYSPAERRYIFEEAAGILRFLQRKKESLKRLEQADLNFSRVQDVHREVEKQIQTLEGQARQARLFKEQKSQLEQLEKASYVLRWQGLEKKIHDLQAKQDKQHKRLKNLQEQGVVRQEQDQQAKAVVQQHDKALRTQSEKLLTLKGQQELQMLECQNHQQRLKETQQREKKLKQEREDLTLARHTRQNMLKEISRKRQQVEMDWNEAETHWVQKQEQVKRQEKEVSHLRQELTIKQQNHLKSLQQNSQCETDLKQAEVRLENHIERHKQLDSRYQQLATDGQQLAQSIQERRRHLQQLSSLVDSHKDRLDHYEEDLKKFAQEGEVKHKELEGLRRKVMEGKARQKVLLNMREDYEGFSSGSKRLLQESQNPKSPLYQMLRPLYEWIQPQAESAEAVAIVLRAYAQTLVIEREQDFKCVLAFAEKNELQDYSLFCMEWIAISSSPSLPATQSFIPHMAAHPLAQHFLHPVGLFATDEEILKAWREGKCQEGWSLEGKCFDHRGVLFKVKPNENQVFIRESELKGLEEDLFDKEEQLTQLEQAVQHLQKKRSQLQLERVELDKMLRRDEMKLVEVNFGLQRALGDQEKNQMSQQQCEQESAALKASYEQHQQTCCLLEQQLTQAKQALLQLQEEKETLQQELNKQEYALKVEWQDQKETGSLYQQLAEDRQHLLHQHNLLEVKEQEHDKQVQRIEEELAELQERQAISRQEELAVQRHLERLEVELQETLHHYNALEKQGEDFAYQLEQAHKQLTLHDEELRQCEQELAQIQIHLAQQQALSQAVSRELAERYRLTMEEALQFCLPLERSFEQTEKQIRHLRQALQEVGNVNLAAIEDLEKHQLRHTFLQQQMEDMQQAKSELLKIIQQLDKESRQLFQETFEVIRANFKKNFQILFNGGEADLQFTESHDALEAGIDIIAKPPGKQMRSISLLSGGEKCLTAVALLFAIFEVKPAPFCILDEIDAPLDDTNVERFVNVVKHFIDRCQFLIITHNKRTMAIGDVLFGVSMEEKGVSKLLSLEFAHKEVPEASLV